MTQVWAKSWLPSPNPQSSQYCRLSARFAKKKSNMDTLCLTYTHTIVPRNCVYRATPGRKMPSRTYQLLVVNELLLAALLLGIVAIRRAIPTRRGLHCFNSDSETPYMAEHQDCKSSIGSRCFRSSSSVNVSNCQQSLIAKLNLSV